MPDEAGDDNVLQLLVSETWSGMLPSEGASRLLLSLAVQPTPDAIANLQAGLEVVYGRFFFDFIARNARTGRTVVDDLRDAATRLDQLRALLMYGKPSDGVHGRIRAISKRYFLTEAHAGYDRRNSLLSPPGTPERQREISAAFRSLELLRQAVDGALQTFRKIPDLERRVRQAGAIRDWGLRPGAKPRTPDFDIAIGRFAALYEELTGKPAGASERSATLKEARASDGPFVRFVVAASEIADRHAGDQLRDLDPVWRKLLRPTPDEIREALRRFRQDYQLPLET